MHDRRPPPRAHHLVPGFTDGTLRPVIARVHLIGATTE
jgi:hypothetical protein